MDTKKDVCKRFNLALTGRKKRNVYLVMSLNVKLSQPRILKLGGGLE